MTLRFTWAFAVAALVGCGGATLTVADSGATGASSGSAATGSASSGSTSGTSQGSGASGTASSGHSGATSGTGASGTVGGSGATGGTGAASGSATSGTGGTSGSTSAGASGAPWSSGGSGSGAASGATSGAATGSSSGAAATCPIVAPNQGSLCSAVGLECEYGSNPNLACNQLATCRAASVGATWSYAASSKCPAPICAATYDAITPGSPCAPQDGTCAYPKGTCVCSSSQGGPVRIVDGGVVTDWACFPATVSCRSPRPSIGSACAEPGRVCDYGACSGGVELQCTNGLWQEALVACAL